MGKEKNAGGKKLVVSSAKAKSAAVVLKKPRVKAARESADAISLKEKRVSSVSPPPEPVIDLTAQFEQRIAELTVEKERLVGEVKLANEGLESLRGELQMRSDHLADVMEGLGIATQDNAVLVKLNGELRTKILAGEVSAEEAHRTGEELARGTEQLVGELKLANEALEAARAELRKQSTQQRSVTEQLDVASHEKIALARRNEELRAKVSGLEARAKKADRLEDELAVARVALRQAGDDLTKARESAEAVVKAEMPVQALPMSSVKPEEKPEPTPSVTVEVRVEPSKISDRVAPAVLAQRCVSDPTNEQFDKIRRSIVDKKNQKANKTLLERFLVPFRDTPRIS